MMLHVTTWLWSQNGYRKRFRAEHVNTLARMVRRNLTLPHEFVCVTNEPKGLDKHIRVLGLPATWDVAWSAQRPNCFRRLWAFSEAARHLIGRRIVSMDLDCVVTGNLDALFSRTEDIVLWRDPKYPGAYNGSMWLMTAGSRREVWDRFRGNESLPELAGRRGSDQAWLSHVLGPNEATWSKADGVLSYRLECGRGLPKGARIVFFHGQPNPWDTTLPWVAEHYR